MVDQFIAKKVILVGCSTFLRKLATSRYVGTTNVCYRVPCPADMITAFDVFVLSDLEDQCSCVGADGFIIMGDSYSQLYSRIRSIFPRVPIVITGSKLHKTNKRIAKDQNCRLTEKTGDTIFTSLFEMMD